MKHKVLIGLILITVLGCGQQSVDTKAEGEKVMQTSREWAKAASTGDIETTLSYWTDGCCCYVARTTCFKREKRDPSDDRRKF